MLYLLPIEYWTEWWDLGIPDEAYTTVAQDARFSTLIRITDPAWLRFVQQMQPDFVELVWIH